MSTRSFIAKQIEKDAYLTVYCHNDGYLTYNGALLLDCYNTPEQVDELLKLGDLSYLAESSIPILIILTALIMARGSKA